MVETSLWMQKVAADPGHSRWYIERFRAMARAGDDLVGEARFVDAMAARGSHILCSFLSNVVMVIPKRAFFPRRISKSRNTSELLVRMLT